MLVLEAALEQEQAMHGVTKAQLASLREDNQRLRQQLHAIRRHTVIKSEPATLVFHVIVFVCTALFVGNPWLLRAYLDPVWRKFGAGTFSDIQGGSKKVSCCTVIDISMARQ